MLFVLFRACSRTFLYDMSISVLEKVDRIDKSLRETRESTFIEMFNLVYMGMNKKSWLLDNLQSANKIFFLISCIGHEPQNSNLVLFLIYVNLYVLLLSLSDEDLLKIEINYSLSLWFYVYKRVRFGSLILKNVFILLKSASKKNLTTN